MKIIQGAIFDMDGTLVDNLAYHDESWAIFLKDYNAPIDINGLAAVHFGTFGEIANRIFNREFSHQEVLDMAEYKESIYRELYRPHLKEIQGLTSFLSHLKSMDIKIGLSTMSDPYNIEFTMPPLGIDSFFGAMTHAHDITQGKPHPEVFLTTMQKLSVDPECCIAFEDTTNGVKAALASGAKVVGITTTMSYVDMMDLGCVHAMDNYHLTDELLQLLTQ
jgi:beta-phosphoglucomutase